jgi:hypothetical protein
LHVSPEVLILNCAYFGLCPEKLAVSGLFGLVERKPRRTIAQNELPPCIGKVLGES